MPVSLVVANLAFRDALMTQTEEPSSNHSPTNEFTLQGKIHFCEHLRGEETDAAAHGMGCGVFRQVSNRLRAYWAFLASAFS